MFWYDGIWQIPLDMGGSRKNRKRLADFKNMLAFQIVFQRLAEDSVNRYEIEGLPETISKRVVLQSLLWHGNVIFFEKGGNLFALPGCPSGEYNVYGEPAMAEVYSVNGYFNEPVKLYLPGSDEASFLERTDVNGYFNEPVKFYLPGSDEASFLERTDRTAPAKAKGVIVWENKQRYPFINSVFYYAERIADTLRTLDVVRENIKTPQLFFCEESVKNSVERFLEERESNISAIVSTGVFDVNKVKTVPIDPKGTALSDITALVEWYENKFRELCGTENNGQMDKKGENLVQAEVEVNDQYTELGVDKCIETMQEYFDYVNDIFGTSITVKKKEAENEEESDLSGNDNDGAGDVSDNSGQPD